MKNIVAAGNCPECGLKQVDCKYNHFQNEELTIDAWEHRCHNCGWRITTAYRSDDEDLDLTAVDPQICPHCSRHSTA